MEAIKKQKMLIERMMTFKYNKRIEAKTKVLGGIMNNKLHLDMQKKIVDVSLKKLRALPGMKLESNDLKNKYLEIMTEYRTNSITYFRNFYRAAKRFYLFLGRTIEKGGGESGNDAEMFKLIKKTNTAKINVLKKGVKEE